MVSPRIVSPRVSIAEPYKKMPRKTRRPQHRFNLKTKPFQIQPFMIAPVLPGESLVNGMLQSQVWSDPLAAGMKNVGWWCEYFLFYVKHRDLAGYEAAVDGLGKDLIDMFVSSESIASHQDADGNAWTYCPPGGVDFTLEALKSIVENYFRDGGEAWDVALLDGVPLAKIYGKGSSDWTEKLTLASAYQNNRVDLDVDNDGTVHVDEIDRAYAEWAALADAGLMDMDYDDWMRTYGSRAVVGPPEDLPEFHKPEDIAHLREFTYPTNTVEPTTGTPATAVGWRVAKRLDKKIFFKEPGWLVGINVIRPKIYLGNQVGSVAAMMQTKEAWLPAVLNDKLDVSHLLIDDLVGPLGPTMLEDYWIDLRDLLNYGDQFVNYTPTGVPFMALPTATASRRYAAETEIEALMGTPATGVFTQDGLMSLSILGRQPESRKTHSNLVLGAG